METPSIIKGKYKVTLRFGYATSMDFIRTKSSGSNGGQMIFSFDGEHSVTRAPYTSSTTTLKSNKLGCYEDVIYDEIEQDIANVSGNCKNIQSEIGINLK